MIKSVFEMTGFLIAIYVIFALLFFPGLYLSYQGGLKNKLSWIIFGILFSGLIGFALWYVGKERRKERLMKEKERKLKRLKKAKEAEKIKE